MSVYLSPIGNDQEIDANGVPLNLGTITTYLAGTSTLATTYTSSTGLTAQANPIVLNSLGIPANPIWLTGGIAYKFVFANSAGATTRPTVDNITGVGDPANFSVSEWTLFQAAPTYVSATSFTVAGDQTNTFQVGRRIRTTNTGGTIYSTISTSAYGSSTTVTVVNDSGTLDSGLSAVSYGILSVTNPSLQQNVVLSTITPAFGGLLRISRSSLVVNAANSRVGIGTASPAVSLHVVGGANTELARFDDGTVAIGIGTTSSDGFIGTGTNDPMRIISNGTAVATFSTGQMTLPNDGAIECSSGALFSQTVYNNTTATSADVSVSGVNGALRRSTSSLRYKFAVETVKPERSDFLHQLRPIWYRSSCEMDRKDWSYYGFAAEEVALLEPRIVHWEQDPDKAEGELRPSGLMYDRITVFLVMEIQKLKARLDVVESRRV